MHTLNPSPNQPAITRVSPLRLALAILAIALLLVTTSPFAAYGLTVERCTAKSNARSGNDVMGAMNTRITWEAQCNPTEAVRALSFTLPDGTQYSTDDARVTMLSGADLMTREVIEGTVTADGQTITFDFDDPADAGCYLRAEIYNVFFPGNGGAMQIEGTYTLADGTTLPIEGIPPIEVKGVSPAEEFSQMLAQQPWVQAWNSNKFLHMFLDPTIAVTSFPVVFWGFLMAIAIVAVAFPLAIPFGLLFALMRMSKFRVLRAIGGVYVNVVRGTPLFLQIYIAFFGLPLAGIQIPSFPLGVIVLAMNSCAYMCEIFRAGIQSIPKGQFEAARSLGMNGAQTMIFIIIPQTVRRVIPTLTSEFILLYKDTSMLAAVGVMEVVMYAKTIVAATGSITPYIVAACFYLVITLPLAKVVGNFEAKLAGNETGKGAKKKRKKKNKGGGSGGEAVPALAVAGGGEVADELAASTEAERLAVDAVEDAATPEDVGTTPEEISSL